MESAYTQQLIPCGDTQFTQLVILRANTIHWHTNGNKDLATTEEHTQPTQRTHPEPLAQVIRESVPLGHREYLAH